MLIGNVSGGENGEGKSTNMFKRDLGTNNNGALDVSANAAAFKARDAAAARCSIQLRHCCAVCLHSFYEPLLCLQLGDLVGSELGGPSGCVSWRTKEEQSNPSQLGPLSSLLGP